MARSRYLYDQQGPWPQPNPLNHKLFPAVLHLPFKERLQWNLLIGLRYGAQMLYYTPVALLYGLLNPSPRILEDEELEERFDNTVFNKMIVPFSKQESDAASSDSATSSDSSDSSTWESMSLPGAQEPVLRTQRMMRGRKQRMAAKIAWQRFPKQMRSVTSTDETRFFIADFSIFDGLPTYPGTYAAGTTVLFKRERPKDRLRVVSIRINGLELTPGDGDAWDLAKLFTMQGATIRLVYSTHALLHFPFDAINAITKDRLPTDHVLFQLLIPHTDLQLMLDKTVQTSFTSPLMNHQLFPWCAHTGPVSGLVRTLEQLYLGVPDNPAFPPYNYKHPRRTPEEKYINFLEAYYQTILGFVQKVLTKVEDDDPHVKQWADYIAGHVPGFPDGDHIFEADPETGLRNLDWAVATFIWDVSVGHTTDHYNMGLLDINENPFRVRVPPPVSKDSTYDRKALRKWTDFFRYKLFWRLFLTATTVYRLANVRYPFEDRELQQYNHEFRQELQRTAEELKHQEFIPLREIARSVQF